MADINNNLNPVIKATKDPSIMIGNTPGSSTLRLRPATPRKSTPAPKQLQTDLSSIFTPPPPTQLQPKQPAIATPTPNNSFKELRGNESKLSTFAKQIMESLDMPESEIAKYTDRLEGPNKINPALVVLIAIIGIVILFNAPFLLFVFFIIIANARKKIE